jgi:uncharacterized protein with PIN domain
MGRKVQRRSTKPCPDCGGQLEIVNYPEEINGVIYDKEFLECLECGIKNALKKNGHKINLNTKYEW